MRGPESRRREKSVETTFLENSEMPKRAFSGGSAGEHWGRDFSMSPMMSMPAFTGRTCLTLNRKRSAADTVVPIIIYQKVSEPLA